MDPIIFGGLSGIIFTVTMSYKSPVKKPELSKPLLIGAVGGGWGGWMASQLWSNPERGSIILFSIVGVVVFDHFLRLGL